MQRGTIHRWRGALNALPGILTIAALTLATGCVSPPGIQHANNGAKLTAARPKQLPFPGFRGAQAGMDTNMTANVVAYRDYRDPLIGYNRVMFSVNDKVYRYVLIPACKGYTWVTPDPIERSIGNFFYNIKTPIYAVNHLLQFKLKKCGLNVVRFTVNSTVGVLGLFDPAKVWMGIERHETHLEDTLAGYGLGYGVYIVLPIFGPSDVRNSLSTLGDYWLNPIPHVVESPADSGVQGFDYLQDFAHDSDRYNTLRHRSNDPYIFFRNLYLQGTQRDAAHR